MTRTAVFGCKDTTRILIEGLPPSIRIDVLVTIGPELGARHEVAGYEDLERFAMERGIEVYSARVYSLKNQGDLDSIRSLSIDLAFVIGWQRLIPAEVLALAPLGFFGMHGSAMDLPLGRGRSPMNWSIIEDRKTFRTNLFKYDCGVDSGDIVDSFVFGIGETDTAETLHFKNALAMRLLIERNAARLLSGKLGALRQQRALTPTYYPKREPSDSLIDWERDIQFIERFVRAVSRPFNGAYTFLNGHKLTIFSAATFELDSVNFGYDDAMPGQVVEVFPNGKFLVKCLGGLLLIHECATDGSVVQGAQLNNGGQELRSFALNRHGYHDVTE